MTHGGNKYSVIFLCFISRDIVEFYCVLIELYYCYRRVSIIRGKVLFRDGSAALGTRVDLPNQLSIGFTLTREDGT